MRTVVTGMSLAGFVNGRFGLSRAWLRIATRAQHISTRALNP